MRSRILLALLILLLPSLARADETKEQEETRSYGGAIVLVDGISAMMLVPGFIAASHRSAKPEVYLGAAAYALGGPTVHIFHRQYGRAVGSFAFRLLPMAGLIALANSREPTPRGKDPRCVGPDYDRQFCDSDSYGQGLAEGLGQIAGLVLVGFGMIATTGIDAAALAKEPVVRVKPTASLTPSSWSIGLGGTF